VSIQALILSLTAIVRPTSLAALFAMLSTGHSRRLLVCYLAAGMSFSVGVGIVVVLVLGGNEGRGRGRTDRPVLDVVLGVCLLAYALLIALRRPQAGEGPRRPAAWMRRLTADMSPPVAALTGVLTHLPGVVYLAALSAIAGTKATPLGQGVQVFVYNAVWFSLTIVALVLAIYRPSASRDLLERINAVAHRYRRPIVSGCLAAFGAYLVFTGATEL
jgi:uncharacterized membrane protein YfcA